MEENEVRKKAVYCIKVDEAVANVRRDKIQYKCGYETDLRNYCIQICCTDVWGVTISVPLLHTVLVGLYYSQFLIVIHCFN